MAKEFYETSTRAEAKSLKGDVVHRQYGNSADGEMPLAARRDAERKSVADFDVIVIGAGLGGLAAASMIAQKGKRVLVLERHVIPGGFATNFTRGDFTFDVSCHSFDGVKPGGPSFEIIKACGVDEKVEFIKHPHLYRYIDGGVDVTVDDGDIEAYAAQLAAMFPSEAKNIRKLLGEAEKNYRQVASFVSYKLPFAMKVAAMPFLFWRVLRHEHKTVDQFLSRHVSDEKLRQLLTVQWSYFGLPPSRLAYSYFSYPFIDYLQYGGHSIKGGSQALSDALVEVIRNNGGQVLTGASVKKIDVEGGKVVGVDARGIGRCRAKKYISNISPRAVVDLAGEGEFPEKFKRGLSQMRDAISGVQVYLGLDCPIESLGVRKDEMVLFVGADESYDAQYDAMQRNEIFGERTAFSINVSSNVDPSTAPAGKSCLALFTLSGASFWGGMSRDEYLHRKDEITKALIRRAEKLIPNLSAHIEVCETGTPRTMTRYTANPSGNFYGFEQSVDQAGLLRRFSQRYPVRNLYQVGAWTFPGAGYIGTLISAKLLVDRYF